MLSVRRPGISFRSVTRHLTEGSLSNFSGEVVFKPFSSEFFAYGDPAHPRLPLIRGFSLFPLRRFFFSMNFFLAGRCQSPWTAHARDIPLKLLTSALFSFILGRYSPCLIFRTLDLGAGWAYENIEGASFPTQHSFADFSF